MTTLDFEKLYIFCKKYGEEYEKVFHHHINIESIIGFESYDLNNAPFEYLEIFDYLSIIKNSIYKEHANLISNLFDLKYMNLIEIACGFIPNTSIYLKNKTISNIHVYDPNLCMSLKIPQIVKNKELFNGSTFNSNTLLFGINSCDATMNIVKEALLKNQNFYVALCCVKNKSELDGFYDLKNNETSLTRLIYVINKLASNYNRETNIEYLDSDIYKIHPIVYSKKL